jgi:hypothetical protein
VKTGRLMPLFTLLKVVKKGLWVSTLSAGQFVQPGTCNNGNYPEQHKGHVPEQQRLIAFSQSLDDSAVYVHDY